jgi:hypothetical protein
MELLESVVLDKKAFSVGVLPEASDEKDFWVAASPGKRLQAVEIMRQIVYGYDPSTTRLQRVLAVTQRP